MKEDYEKNDSLSLTLRCLSALAMIPSSDVTEVVFIVTGNMLSHKKMLEFLTYFEYVYIRDGRRPGRSQRYGSVIFPVERRNDFETVSEGIARTANSIES